MIALRGRKGRIALTALCVMTVLFVFVALCYAGGGHGEEGAHGAAHDSGRQLTDLLYRFINFALLVIILVVVLRKVAVTDFFSARREEIETQLDDLKREKEAAEARYKELETKLKKFEEKKEEIIEQFKLDGAAEKDRIIAEARDRAKQILAQADLTIEREIEAARNRLRREVVEAASTKAQEIISKDITDGDQDKMVAEFIERVEKLN